MNKKKEQVKLEDHCYKFEEMKDQMVQSLFNIEKVLKEQKVLMKIVKEGIEKFEEKEKQPYEEFLKDTESQNKQLEEQKEILSKRIGFLSAVLERCKDNAANAELVSLLAEALGMFKK